MVFPRLRWEWTGPNEGAVRVANTHGCAAMVSGTPLPPARPVLIRDTRPLRCRPDPASAGHLRDHRANGLSHIHLPGQRKRRKQRMAHPAPPALQPGNEDLHEAARYPDIAPVARPEHHRHPARRAPRTREPLPASGDIGIDRERARPYDGHRRHRLRSLLATVAKRGREGIFTFNRDGTILARSGPNQLQHPQKAQPDTRHRCSGNQAVNSRYWRSRPLVFSLVPRCQGECGSAK